jgi:hypothetical protein
MTALLASRTGTAVKVAALAADGGARIVGTARLASVTVSITEMAALGAARHALVVAALLAVETGAAADAAFVGCFGYACFV